MKTKNTWWTKGDPIWGGETFQAEQNSNSLGIKKGDRFRLERANGSLGLIPHPQNKGAWTKCHDKDNPIRLKPRATKKLKRVFTMDVRLEPKEDPKAFFLAERKDFGIVIMSDDPDDPRGNGGIARIRR